MLLHTYVVLTWRGYSASGKCQMPIDITDSLMVDGIYYINGSVWW